MYKRLAMAAAGALAAAGPVAGQAQDAWRATPAENLLVLDTTKGRVLVEMAPHVAPAHVERLRTLAGQGFYDGQAFHRVIRDFMAQTGDPSGTGAGGSDLPNLPGEFRYRRGRDIPFIQVTGSDAGARVSGILGLHGNLPVVTQPDAQMMLTADFKVDASAWFCPGVAGMARTEDPNSANSQFYLMTGTGPNLNGQYTVWGRVVDGLDVVERLKAGPMEANGAVGADPDRVVRARVATDLPEAERPRVEVMDVRSPAFQAVIEEARAARGSRFSICDIQVPTRVAGG